MLTKILKPSKESIKLASQILQQGGVIIYPTESSYGMGADATNQDAVIKVREVKGRDNKPIGVIVDSLETAKKYCYLTVEDESLVKKYMPGQLTICAKKKDIVLDVLNKERFSFRIPGDETALNLAKLVGKPITATSANLSGHKPIFKVKGLEIFLGKVDLILDAGDLEENPPSTIIEDGRIVRQGAVKIV